MLTMHSCLDDSDSDGNIESGSRQASVKKKGKKRRKKERQDAVEHLSEGRVTRSMARTPSFASRTTC